VAGRYGLKVFFVANSRMRIPENDLVELIVVNDHLDAADDWIAEHITPRDIAVSADIPLVSRCLDKGARVLDPKGRIFTEDSIAEALAHRDLMTYLRDQGNMTGGPPPYGKLDRSRFLQRLDDLVHAALRERRDKEGTEGV
jgi:uncharacterized protein